LNPVSPWRVAISFGEWRSTGELLCMECVSEAAWLCRCCRVLDSVDACGFLILSQFCCSSMVPYQSGHCLSVACSCPRVERACPYPIPRGWCRACCCGAMRDFSDRPFGCCSIVSGTARRSCCCPVLCSGMRAEPACTCPSAWYTINSCNKNTNSFLHTFLSLSLSAIGHGPAIS